MAGETFEVSTSDLRIHLTELIRDVLNKGNRVCVTAHGDPVAGLVSLDDLERLEGTNGKKRADKKGKR